MDDRQTQCRWPTAWLMTDTRFGDRLWDAIERLPAGAGVVLRDSTDAARVAALCRARRLTLAVARDAALAAALDAEMVHNPERRTTLPFSRSVHDEAEAVRANAERPALVFVSPIFATRSHPGAPVLGIDGAVRLAKVAGVPAIALGGMDQVRFAALEAQGFQGWAGIDAWLQR